MNAAHFYYIRKPLVLLLLVAMTPLLAAAQHFEGKIQYENIYRTKAGEPDQQFSGMLGTRLSYYIKDGNYRTESNGNMLKWQVYIRDHNKLYTQIAGSPVLFYNDGSENKDEVLKAEINKNALTIKGFVCDELILTCKSGIQKYYFSSKLSVDPSHFAQHKFGNWYEIMSRTKAVPLKMIIETPQFNLESTATEVTSEKLPTSLFEIPAEAKTEKNPFG